jgi:thermitase
VLLDQCADDNGHGTHVAGTIAAKANNGIGVAGVAFNADLVVCKALDEFGSGSIADVANCIDWAASQGAKVISMSLVGGDATTVQQAVANAWDGGNGAVIVAAAGNDGTDTVYYPAGYPEVVSVAATDDTDARADFSNANATSRSRRPGWTSSRRASAAGTRRCRARRWPPRTWRAPPGSSGSCIRP